jgi:hypothetical protein
MLRKRPRGGRWLAISHNPFAMSCEHKAEIDGLDAVTEGVC